MKRSVFTSVNLIAAALASCGSSDPIENGVVTLSKSSVQLEPLEQLPFGSDYEIRVAAREAREQPYLDFIESEIAAFAKEQDQPIKRTQGGLGYTTFFYGAVTPERSLYLVIKGEGDILVDGAGELEICRMELDPSGMLSGQQLYHFAFLRSLIDEGDCTLEGYQKSNYQSALSEDVIEAKPYVIAAEKAVGDAGTLLVLELKDLEGYGYNHEVVAQYLEEKVGPVAQTLPLSTHSNLWIGHDGTLVAGTSSRGFREGALCVLHTPEWSGQIDFEDGSKPAIENRARDEICINAVQDFE